MADGTQTPPHYPIHGVHLSDSTISTLLSYCIEGSPTISKLPPGQSYNNRIYTITTTTTATSSAPISSSQYILKVNGHPFGPSKIENEVSWLLLLEHFLPEVPAPRAVAWSTDGHLIQTRRHHSSSSSSPNTTNNNNKPYIEPEGIPDDVPGWILMTRLPGKPLNPGTLSVEQKSLVASRVAQLVLRCRRGIPPSGVAGNLNWTAHRSRRWVDDEEEEEEEVVVVEEGGKGAYRPAALEMRTVLYVHGLQGVGRGDAPPASSLLGFWRAYLGCLVEELRSEKRYEGNREALVPLLEEFIEGTLPRLSIFRGDDGSNDEEGGKEDTEGGGDGGSFVFTNGDLAPRNILVSEDDPTEITGIVDFEFSAFFPPMMEFLGEFVKWERGEEVDWPSDMFGDILRRLEEEGEATPLGLRGTDELAEWTQLDELDTNVAPWWVRDYPDDGLERAREKVEGAVEELKRLVARSEQTL